MRKVFLSAALFLSSLICVSQSTMDKSVPLVNQAGYDTGQAKRFVCWGADDGTPFKIINTRTGKAEYDGRIIFRQGWFTDFDPITGDEYVVEVASGKRSVPFTISDYHFARISSKIAYDFFADARGSTDPVNSNEANVYGGGPTRDQGSYGLESVFEAILYAANPSLYDNWKDELGDGRVPDLIALILWHGEFAYHHHTFNGKTLTRHGSLGYLGQERMSYDYWNTLDQLAPLCAAYHTFLKPYLSEEKYRLYRQTCLDKWTAYDRHKVVRHWTYSNKWVDSGFQEFNEMGNVFGQSVFSNLFMYLCEKNEKDGKPEQFLSWAQQSAQDIIDNWDFNNPRHMWWIRNGEHITPQALAFFLLVAPEHAPKGTKEKLESWAVHIGQKSNNAWMYRSHSETEMAHPKTKELGGAPALGGSLFAVSYLLNDPNLRKLAWAQVDFVFGVNPAASHLSYKDSTRIARGGWWEGVEKGWPDSHPNGYGMLGSVRGTLEGTPLNHHFPEMDKLQETKVYDTDQIGGYAYATEGWGVSNRGWLATVAFSTLGRHSIRLLDKSGSEIELAKVADEITIELRAALNNDTQKVDKGWLEAICGNKVLRVELTETAPNSSLFTGKFKVNRTEPIVFQYGYWGLGCSKNIDVR